MKRSTDRILTTHGGSLTRSDELLAMIQDRDAGRPFDQRAFDERVRSETVDVVRRQQDAGIDVISDGELGRTSFSIYANARLSGFEMKDRGPEPSPPLWADMVEFPEYEGQNPPRFPAQIPVCTRPIAYTGQAAIAADIANFKAALPAVRYEEAFVPSATAGMVAQGKRNEHYPTQEAFLFAIADAMREEYRAILDAGMTVQLDSPDIPILYQRTRMSQSMAEYRATVELYIAAIDRSLEGLPADRVRLHICWGNYEGPHHFDVEMKDIADIVVKTRAGGLYVEAANPRHEHEWRVWQDTKLPDGMILVPGVIDTKTNIIEHPELVAERIVRFANLVGRENVIAGTDCGFGTTATRRRVYPSVQWAKLKTLSEGAAIASKQLWG